MLQSRAQGWVCSETGIDREGTDGQDTGEQGLRIHLKGEELSHRGWPSVLSPRAFQATHSRKSLVRS